MKSFETSSFDCVYIEDVTSCQCPNTTTPVIFLAMDRDFSCDPCVCLSLIAIACISNLSPQVVRRLTSELKDTKMARNMEKATIDDRLVQELQRQLDELKESRDRQNDMLATVKNARWVSIDSCVWAYVFGVLYQGSVTLLMIRARIEVSPA